MIAVVILFVALCLGIATMFVLLVAVSAALGLLPSNAEAAIAQLLFELSNSFVPSSISMVKIDPICWYGRGNVLYQIGQMRDEDDLLRQRQRAASSMNRILKISNGLSVDAKL